MKQLTLNTADFLDRVATIERRGVSRKQAWDIARGGNPSLHHLVALENSLPKDAMLSPDGEQILTEWPVAPEVLQKLGLPADASQAEYSLYRRADTVEVTADIAALLVRELVQLLQIKHAATFRDALDYLEQHKPAIFKAATQATLGLSNERPAASAPTPTNGAAIALANAMAPHIKAGKTKGQALDQVMVEHPLIHQSYIAAGAGNIPL
jgi:hypothetical protein